MEKNQRERARNSINKEAKKSNERRLQCCCLHCITYYFFLSGNDLKLQFVKGQKCNWHASDIH